MSTVLEALDALLAKASPLPLEVQRHPVGRSGAENLALEDKERCVVAWFIDICKPLGCAHNREATAAYAALAVNHLRLFVAALGQVRSPGGHMPTCIAVGGQEGCVPKCLDASAALAALKRDIEALP